jgi:hypothetical protein
MIKKLYRTIVPESVRKSLRDKQAFNEYQKDRETEGHTYNCFDKTKSIFVHIPKAGGISTIKSLYGQQANGFGHPTYERFVRLYGKEKFDEYYKFTFVRNPWDRLFSGYNFLKEGGMNSLDKNFSATVLKDFDTFEDFVMKWCSEENINSWVHFIPQYKYIYDKNENLVVDFVGRFENFNDDFEKVRSKLEVGEPLKHLNKTKQKKENQYREAYSDEMRDKVYNLYKKDVELLNYSF